MKFRGDFLYFLINNQIIIFQVIFFLYHFSDNLTSFPGQSCDCLLSDGDGISESDDEEPSNNDYEFPNSTTLKEDHRLFDHPTPERLHN